MPDPTPPLDTLRLFDVEPEPDVVAISEETTVLREWGRDRNQSGPKPITYRRVRRTTVSELTERYCSTCKRYLPLADFNMSRRRWCRACTKARHFEEMARHPDRRERMRWHSHRSRAMEVGAVHDVTFEDWCALIDAWAGCVAPGCDGPFDEIDHVVSFTAGGRNVASNLQPLCYRHHAEKTKAERAADASAMWSEVAS